MVDTSAWPNARFSALSIWRAVSPSRDAVSRSKISVVCSPRTSWPALTSATSGTPRNARSGRGLPRRHARFKPRHPGAQVVQLVGLQGELVARVAHAAADADVCRLVEREDRAGRV